MSSLVYLKNPNGTIYVYENVSYWDKETKTSKQKRKSIGHIDPATGNIVPNHKKGDAAKARIDSEDTGNTITIGASGVTLTGLSTKQNDTISALEEDVVGQSGRIDVISGQVDRINESKMYRTELVTEGVSIFREKTQRSTVRCKVYSWDNEITDTLPASAFNWHRNSGNTEADAAWDTMHTGMKTIMVSTEDVTDNASFFCEVTI